MLTHKKDRTAEAERKKTGSRHGKQSHSWPVRWDRPEVRWFPASSRLIGLVRANVDKFVLPPAVVRKASWRD